MKINVQLEDKNEIIKFYNCFFNNENQEELHLDALPEINKPDLKAECFNLATQLVKKPSGAEKLQAILKTLRTTSVKKLDPDDFEIFIKKTKEALNE